MTNPTAFIIVERNTEDNVWRVISIETTSDYKQIQQIAEDANLTFLVNWVIEHSDLTPTHIQLPDGSLDDGGELTLAEVAELVFISAANDELAHAGRHGL